MRTIHADLLVEQKKTAYTPSLSLAIQDNGLPHPEVGLSHPMTGASGAPTAAVVAGSAIVRAHVSGGAVLVQRITDPAESAQWTSGWTTLTAGAGSPALFYTGAYVVCVYQKTSGGAVCWKRSDDDGATWSAEQTIWTPAYSLGTLVLGASGGATRSGLFYANGTTVYFRVYDPTADAFSAATSHNYGDTVASFGVCYDAGGDAYRLALALGSSNEDYAYDSRMLYALALASYTYGGAWSAPYVHVGLPTTIERPGTDKPDYRSLANFTPAYVCLAKVPGQPQGTAPTFWLTFRVVKGAGCALGNDMRVSVSDDGTHFSGSVKLAQPNIADRLTPLPWTAGQPQGAAPTVYLASDSVLLVSTPEASMTASQAEIIRYETIEGGPEARLEIVLDNRAGTYDGIETDRLGNDLVLSRGAVVAGTVRTVMREPFVIEDVQWSRDNKRVRLTGHNYAALMRFWRADLNYYWRNQTLQTLVQAIAALGGVQACTFDASTFWSTTIKEFTLAPGTSALEALQALQQQFQFVYRVSSSGAMSCFALSDSPAADYVFGTGSGEHPTFRARDTSKRRLPEITHVVVLGEDEHGAEAVLPVQVEAGFQRTRVVTRQYLDTTAACAAQALALATKAEAVESQAVIFCLPSFALELWDAVQSDDWQADQVRYVTNLQEIYNTDRSDPIGGQLSNPFYQVVTLADVDVTLHATGHGLPAPTALTHAYADDGHHLAWFYPGKLTDVLYFELVRNSTDDIDGNETVVYRGRNLQALADYSDTAGDYFGVRAVGAGELASYWVWGGPYTAVKVTVEDKFDTYVRPDLSGLESLCVLPLESFEVPGDWSAALGGVYSLSPDATAGHFVEGAGGLKILNTAADNQADVIYKSFAARDYTAEQRFTGADFVAGAVYTPDHTKILSLKIRFYTSSGNYYSATITPAANGLNFFAVKRSDFGATGSPSWANITRHEFQVTSNLGGYVVLDELAIVKADPDDATTYNPTGAVWDFDPAIGDGAEWPIIAGDVDGEPAHPYNLAQLCPVTTPATWRLAWAAQADVAAGVALVGVYLKTAGQVALAFCIRDPAAATRTLYAAELDTAGTVSLAAWVDGTRTEIDSKPFACAPGEEIWLGVDFRSASRINVYASTTAGNLMQGANLVISQVDSTVERGGFVGVMAQDNARFFNFRAGSPEHAHFAEVAALAERALVADALTVSPIPTGSLMMWPTATAPDGWLLCDGSAVSRTTYAPLFAVIGTTFGSGDGSTTFNLPDFQGRSPQGADGTDSLGDQVGTAMQTLVPQHCHAYHYDVTASSGSSRNQVRASGGSSMTTDYEGEAGGVDQRGPRLAVNFIIKT